MPPEKRKSTRRTTLEAAKRVKTPSKETPKRDAVPSTPVDEPLPTKISSSKPLPVVHGPLPKTERSLQSIAESGVLAASFERSRTKWLSDGFFEKYWTKPSKKKGAVEPPNNPPKETMQKLGGCRITIEPHVFDATLFIIRDPTSKSKAVPKQPPQQSTFPMGITQPMPSPAPGTPASTPQTSALPPRPSNPSPVPVPVKSETPKPKASPIPVPVPAPTPNPRPQPQQHAQTPSSASPVPPVPSPKTGQDPVIQMLAQRASTNPDLKVLMKIVASGNATSDQLRVFQTHIDELTAITQRQNAIKEAQAQAQAKKQQAANANANSHPHFLHTPQSAFGQPGQQPISNATFHAQNPTFSAYPSAFHPHMMKPSPSTYQKQADIAGIAIEFTAGSDDRYLLPKNSIMQHHPPGRQALLSFLIVRKPERADGNNAKAKQEEDVYQPVTLRVWADQQKIFDSISRALNPPDEVRKYMEETMASTKRADSVTLVLRLPRDADGAGETDSGAATPTGSKAVDRRHSLLKSAVQTASPGPEGYTKTGRAKTNPFEQQHCMYCFEAVEAPAQKLEGKTVCPACGALRRKDFINSGAPRRLKMAVRQSAAPLSLLL